VLYLNNMNRNKLYRILISDGFTPPYYVERCTNIKDFLPGSSKTGIYILHFSDETKYVGKSKEISRRFSQHSNNFSDIIAINFKEVPSDELDIAEEKTIKLLEKNKVKLRNILLSSFTYKKTDFYDVIPERDQNLWLTNLNFNDFSGERITDNELREKYKMKFHKFLREPYSDKVIAFLRLYVSNYPVSYQDRIYLLVNFLLAIGHI
jgi:predicted GIY-YIG superfamily endonuclease